MTIKIIFTNNATKEIAFVKSYELKENSINLNLLDGKIIHHSLDNVFSITQIKFKNIYKYDSNIRGSHIHNNS